MSEPKTSQPAEQPIANLPPTGQLTSLPEDSSPAPLSAAQAGAKGANNREADRKAAEQYYCERQYSAQDVSLAIIGAGLTNAIALLAIKEPFTLWNMIIGAIILCILLVYAPAPTSRYRLQVAYAAIWSLSFLTTIGVFFNILFKHLGGAFPRYDWELVPFPDDPQVFMNTKTGSFTPFNVYEVILFSVGLVIFCLCFTVLLVRRRLKRSNHHSKNAPPQKHQKPISAVAQAQENETGAVPEQPSDQEATEPGPER